ncbi:MAG TPA: C45 family peptidase [Candidatus Acidoferrales bacterium]|nr:C45 family peptidase [Candidatus Acidoferrales bacterium]
MRRTAKLVPLVLLPVIAALAAFAWAARRRPAPATPVQPVNASLARPSLPRDPRLQGSYRFERNGWIYLHLQGSPEQIGYQHGYLLAPEIQDAFAAVKLEDTHDTRRPWSFFRQAAHDMLWPKIDPEYQTELQGIARGLEARGAAMDIEDVVALNAFEELPGYYVPWYDAQHKVAGAPKLASPGNCSAFVATGSFTRAHGVVIGHNNWTSYIDGERWRVMLDIAPQRGYRILMDGFPGVIASDDDFGINSDGLMVTETTISQFYGWDPNGKPEFMRARKALQYAGSIDDYVRIVNDGNNGGYANDWLLGDRKTGEIARFEQGLKHTRLWRTKDGYFTSANFPSDPQVAAQETKFNLHDPSLSPNARHARWDELMQQNKGRIDAALAQQFESDHFDTYTKRQSPDQRTLCGHVDAAAAGQEIWDWGPYYPGGAVQSKVTDSQMAAHMSLIAHLGHPCGEPFYAKPFLAAHPQYHWMAPVLRDMPAYPWTTFASNEQPQR